MTKQSVSVIKAQNASIIKENNNQEIAPTKDKALRNNVADSFANLKDGGMEFESAVGYLTELAVTDPKAFVALFQVQLIAAAAAGAVDLTLYFKKDGSIPMEGDIDAGGNNIINVFDIKDPINGLAIGVDARSLYDALGRKLLDFYDRDGGVQLHKDDSIYAKLDVSSLSAFHNYTFPNKSITFAGLDDIPTVAGVYMPLSGGTFTGAITLNADASSALQPVSLQQAVAMLSGYEQLQKDYDVSTNLYPTASDTSPVVASIKKGMSWYVKTGTTGVLNSKTLVAGDEIIALTDSPGQTDANWLLISHAIGYAPVSNVLNSAQIFVGNASNVATGVAITGDISITNAGVVAIGASKVTNSMLAGGIDLTSKVTGALPDANIASASSWNAKVSSQWVATGSDIYYSTGNVMIGNATAPLTKLHVVETSTATLRGVLFGQYSTDTLSSKVTTRKARGTYGSPTTIVTADVLSNWTTAAYDGATFIDAASIRTTSVGTIGTGRTPTKMEFMTMTDVTTGVLTTALTLDQSQNSIFSSNIYVPNIKVLKTGGTPGTLTDYLDALTSSSGATNLNIGGASWGRLVLSSTSDVLINNSSNLNTSIGRAIIQGTSTLFTMANSIVGTTVAYAIAQNNSGATFLNSLTGQVTTLSIGLTAIATISSTAITISDGINIIGGTTTGVKLLTATNQKLGVWGATPITQPTTAIAAATFVANTSGTLNDTATWDGYTVGQVVKALRNLGILA